MATSSRTFKVSATELPASWVLPDPSVWGGDGDNPVLLLALICRMQLSGMAFGMRWEADVSSCTYDQSMQGSRPSGGFSIRMQEAKSISHQNSMSQDASQQRNQKYTLCKWKPATSHSVLSSRPFLLHSSKKPSSASSGKFYPWQPFLPHSVPLPSSKQWAFTTHS